MNSPFSIRRVSQQEVKLLQEISATTFTDAFAAQNKAEDMAQYLNTAFSIMELAKELDDADNEFYFVEHASMVVGYIKLKKTCSYSLPHYLPAVELERIYVLKNNQKSGIGQMLLDFVFLWARKQNARSLCLGVWEHNAGAIRFYERNGFTSFGSHIFMLGTDPQTDILMTRTL